MAALVFAEVDSAPLKVDARRKPTVVADMNNLLPHNHEY